MGVRATCPHCGAFTSRVRSQMRCNCGWADPDWHRPYRRMPTLDRWMPDTLEAALADHPEQILDDLRAQLDRPPISTVDHEEVLHQEPYRWRDGDFDIVIASMSRDVKTTPEE